MLNILLTAIIIIVAFALLLNFIKKRRTEETVTV